MFIISYIQYTVKKKGGGGCSGQHTRLPGWGSQVLLWSMAKFKREPGLSCQLGLNWVLGKGPGKNEGGRRDFGYMTHQEPVGE